VEDVWLRRDERARARRAITPPVEMHLREMADVDLRSPESIRVMCEATGQVVDPQRPTLGVTDVRHPERAKRKAQADVERTAQRLGLATPQWAKRPSGAVHVAEVAHRVAIIRTLVDHVHRALTDRPTAPTWQAVGAFEDVAEPPLPDTRDLENEDPEALAWWWFAESLNLGLGEIQPHIVPPPIESQEYADDIKTAFGAACVLVFNDLQESIPYRRCADETCGRIFRRQLGRSKGGFSRAEGVAYCSPTHARNQSQRERRRERRAARLKE
jgi:hypothetical protein